MGTGVLQNIDVLAGASRLSVVMQEPFAQPSHSSLKQIHAL